MFSYLYYNSYVGAEVGVTVGSVLSSAVQLSRREQLELWGLLANLLAGGLHAKPPVLTPAASEALIPLVVWTLICEGYWLHPLPFTMGSPFHWASS